MSLSRIRLGIVCASIIGIIALCGTSAFAQVDFTFEYAPDVASLSLPIDSSDALTGLGASSILLNSDLAVNFPLNTNGYVPINNMPSGCESSPISSPNAGVTGFHPASGDPTASKLKLVDGLVGVNVDGVLADFAWPAAVFQFDLAAATDIGEIRVFAANTDRDGRVFQNYDVLVSTDTNVDTKERVFTPLIDSVMAAIVVCGPDGYFPNVNDGCQLDANGVPVGQPCDPNTKTITDRIGASLTRVYDVSNTTLAANVTSVRFVFYAVSNTQRVFRDEHVGPLGCTIGLDPASQFDIEDIDGFQRGIESSIIKEIDVIASPRTTLVEDCNAVGDEDLDGLADELDPDCFGVSCAPEDCTNGVDDNGNTLIDCDDPDCLLDLSCGNAEICDNGIDDDGDLLVDCLDVDDCGASPVCQCNDPFADADGDGDVDQTDFAQLQLCLAGIGGGLGLECICFDRSSPGDPGVPDGDISSDDLQYFFDCTSGPDVPADPGCDDEE